MKIFKWEELVYMAWVSSALFAFFELVTVIALAPWWVSTLSGIYLILWCATSDYIGAKFTFLD